MKSVLNEILVALIERSLNVALCPFVALYLASNNFILIIIAIPSARYRAPRGSKWNSSWSPRASRSSDIARSIWYRFTVYKPPSWPAIFLIARWYRVPHLDFLAATTEIAAGNDAATMFTQTLRVETILQDSRIRARGLVRSCESARAPSCTSLPLDVNRGSVAKIGKGARTNRVIARISGWTGLLSSNCERYWILRCS